jgi:hypothetical protein
LVGGFGPYEGLAAVVTSVDEGPDLDQEVSDGGKRAAVDGLAFDDAEQTSTRFSHDPEAGVKWIWILRIPRQPGLHLRVLVGGVVRCSCWSGCRGQGRFKFSTDPEAGARVTDVVHPPWLHPMRQAERRTHDYIRHGTTTLFAALEIATGQVKRSCSASMRRPKFRR